MKARVMVLCAGLGTRLRPLTEELPKPLVPLGDRPLLAHIVDRLRAAGFTSAVANAHHLMDVFQREIERIDFSFYVILEDTIRGTAGGVAGARTLLGDPPVVVWNGDILADVDLGDLGARAGDGLAFAVARRPRGEGTVGLGAEGQVVRLRGESFGEELEGGDFVGVSALGAAALASLPEVGCLVADVALPALRRGERVASVPVAPRWTDLGSIVSYHAANLEWLDTHHAGDSFVHPSAHVAAGVRVVRSIVGEGASVEGSGAVVRSVIWPGARAVAPLSDCIVTGQGRVVSAS